MSINAISMSSCMTIDSEYQRIMRQLRAYGIEPTGDKSVDKAKLQRIEQAKESQNSKLQNPNDNKQKSEEEVSSEQFVDRGQGTDQIAMLNKLKLGLL